MHITDICVLFFFLSTLKV